MAAGFKTGGRQPGTQNKFSKSAKEAFQHAFEQIGGAEKLAEWAGQNQTEFYKLFSKLIPTDVNVNDVTDVSKRLVESRKRIGVVIENQIAQHEEPLH